MPASSPTEEERRAERVIVNAYRTQTFNTVFRMKYCFLPRNGYWVIYCLSRPRDPKQLHHTQVHLLAGEQLCITSGYEPQTFSKAVAAAYKWMVGYSTYLHGGYFPNGHVRVTCHD